MILRLHFKKTWDTQPSNGDQPKPGGTIRKGRNLPSGRSDELLEFGLFNSGRVTFRLYIKCVSMHIFYSHKSNALVPNYWSKRLRRHQEVCIGQNLDRMEEGLKHNSCRARVLQRRICCYGFRRFIGILHRFIGFFHWFRRASFRRSKIHNKLKHQN